MKWVSTISRNARVIALTGELDDNTLPRIAESWVEALQANSVNAEFKLLGGYTHNTSFRSPEVFRAIQEFLLAK